MRSTVFGVAAIVIVSMGMLAFTTTNTDSACAIEYRVECRRCDIAYRDESGNTKEIEGMTGKWTYRFSGIKGQFIYVSAMDVQGGPVRVSIWKEGKMIASDEARAENSSARTGTIL